MISLHRSGSASAIACASLASAPGRSWGTCMSPVCTRSSEASCSAALSVNRWPTWPSWAWVDCGPTSCQCAASPTHRSTARLGRMWRVWAAASRTTDWSRRPGMCVFSVCLCVYLWCSQYWFVLSTLCMSRINSPLGQINIYFFLFYYLFYFVPFSVLLFFRSIVLLLFNYFVLSFLISIFLSSRKSFFSGHASFAMYTALYLAVSIFLGPSDCSTACPLFTAWN